MLRPEFSYVIPNKSVGPNKCVGKKMLVNKAQKLFLIYFLDKRKILISIKDLSQWFLIGIASNQFFVIIPRFLIEQTLPFFV